VAGEVLIRRRSEGGGYPSLLLVLHPKILHPPEEGLHPLLLAQGLRV